MGTSVHYGFMQQWQDNLVSQEGSEASRLRELFLACNNNFPDVVSAAQHLGMSNRTLIRRLTKVGTSYSEILSEVRMDRVASLMRQGVSIRNIGPKVGYNDPSNFRRAFKGWTGMTPEVFRQTLLHS